MNEIWMLQCPGSISPTETSTAPSRLSSHRDAEIIPSQFASYIIDRHAGSEGGTAKWRWRKVKEGEGRKEGRKKDSSWHVNVGSFSLSSSCITHSGMCTYTLLVNNAARAQCAIHTDHCRLLIYTALLILSRWNPLTHTLWIFALVRTVIDKMHWPITPNLCLNLT